MGAAASAMEQQDSSIEQLKTTCCIVGGGPAGMIAGFLLARAGVDVIVLEKHSDFLRDFRGDTIHPSTLELMYELGILKEFLQQPHQELAQVGAQIGDATVPVADFSHLPTHCKFIALMPQWHFLNFIAEQGKAFPQFHLRMETEVADLIQANNRIAGVRARTSQGVLEVRADLTLGTDGRHSTVREKAGLDVIDLGAPIDVLWMRLPRQPDDPNETLGRVRDGKILVTLNRGDYWQCAYVIPKGGLDVIRQKGLPAFREDIVRVAPFLWERVGELKDWDDIKLLTVAVDRLRQWWRSGLLCLGDSAHAMSPVGGVGINLAIQDAVAATNILASALLRGTVSDADLNAVQTRREFPTHMTQRLQVFAHRKLISPALGLGGESRVEIRDLPLPLRLLQRFPVLRRIPARVLGLGFRPELVHGKAWLNTLQMK
jgi:2-polyprenyl-6-methoxyphenol hydroxylase-like FAD-dependent oxidoreductase